MIFFVAMPFVIGLMNLVVPLQLGVRDVAFPTLNSVGFWLTATGALLVNISLVVGEFARTGWLPYPPLSELTYSPGVGVDYYSLVAADLRRRHAGRRHQSRHDGPEDPHPRHDLSAHADVLLDHARLEPADRRRVPDPDRDARDADPRPLSRLPLLHQRGRRQRDDVHEPDLGLGTSGGLHPGAAGLRHLLRGGLDLLRQAAVRLPLDGARHHGDLRHLLHGVAASLLHHGRRARRQRDLRHRQHDHRGADRREDLQLAVHDVSAAASASRRRCCGRSASW